MATLSDARRIVIKIGSALLVDRRTGALKADWLRALAEDVAWLKTRAEVILVSSGSIALGRGALGLGLSELALEQSQAAAAVGQIRLARAYEEALAPHGLTTAQVLVTLEDSSDRRRYLNSRATLETLISLGAVPIVNENDTVATDEIRYGDNDRMAAQVATLKTPGVWSWPTRSAHRSRSKHEVIKSEASKPSAKETFPLLSGTRQSTKVPSSHRKQATGSTTRMGMASAS